MVNRGSYIYELTYALDNLTKETMYFKTLKECSEKCLISTVTLSKMTKGKKGYFDKHGITVRRIHSKDPEKSSKIQDITFGTQEIESKKHFGKYLYEINIDLGNGVKKTMICNSILECAKACKCSKQGVSNLIKGKSKTLEKHGFSIKQKIKHDLST